MVGTTGFIHCGQSVSKYQSGHCGERTLITGRELSDHEVKVISEYKKKTPPDRQEALMFTLGLTIQIVP